MLLIKSSKHCASHPSKHVTFDLCPAKSFYKTFFQGTELGETLKKMLLSKAVPEGLKEVECKHNLWGKHYPTCYISEMDPIQEALETKTPANSFETNSPRWE
jgi:hypothetical protein